MSKLLSEEQLTNYMRVLMAEGLKYMADDLKAHIEALTEESNIISTAASELREGATYWEDRALRAEAKSEERRAALQELSQGIAWHYRPGALRQLVTHAFSDDAAGTVGVVEHEHRWAMLVELRSVLGDMRPFLIGKRFCADCKITAGKVEVK